MNLAIFIVCLMKVYFTLGIYKKAKVSKNTFYKIKNGDNVTTNVFLRICIVLECDISEIVECVNDSSEGI
ncbi:helix-turn-helix domain-containing protein [Mycoplasmopsis primatum]